jgi:hypothetical protein
MRELLEHCDQRELISSVNNKIYYGYKEKERLTESFFVENPHEIEKGDGKRILYAVSQADCINRYSFSKLTNIGKNMDTIFSNNIQILNFTIGLLDFGIKMIPDQVQKSFQLGLKALTLNMSSPSFKINIANLLVIAFYIKPLENDIISTLIDALISCDNEFGVKNSRSSPMKYKKLEQDIDFFMKILLVHLKNQLKGVPKHEKVNKDLFINHYISCLFSKTLSQFRYKVAREKNEALIYKVINIFCEKIIKIDRPNCVQYLVVFIANLDYKLKLKPHFDCINSYFLHTLVQQIYSKMNQNYIKEKILLYIYSYVKSCKLSSHFIYTIIYYLEQFLRIISKRIVRRIKTEFPDIKSFDDFLMLDERKQGVFLNIFNNSLFIKLIYYISLILNENLEELSTENTIDIINLFEAYFNKFIPYLKIVIKSNVKAKSIFYKLNKFLNNPLINDLSEIPENFPQNGASPSKRGMLIRSNSNGSKSSWSNCSFDSYTSIYNNDNNSVCSWSFNTDFLPFKKISLSFFCEHIRQNFKDCALYPAMKDSIKDTENSLNLSQAVSKKNSFHELDFSCPPHKMIKQR